MSVVLAINIAQLAGFVGSNPELISTYPDSLLKDFTKNDIISHTLPSGITPGQILNQKMGDKNVISYCFKIEREGDRDDLTAISVVIDEKDVNIDDFISLYLYITENVVRDSFTLEDLIQSMPSIWQSGTARGWIASWICTCATKLSLLGGLPRASGVASPWHSHAKVPTWCCSPATLAPWSRSRRK